MDQVSNRSGVGSDDVTDETTSLVDSRWSSEEDVRKNLSTTLPQLTQASVYVKKNASVVQLEVN